MSKVTDPALLAELEGTSTPSTKVTDPALLAELEGTTPKAQPAGIFKRALAGIADPGIGIAQIADKVVVNPIRQLISPGASSMDDYVREREAGLKADGFDAARMVGNVASPLNYVVPGGAATVRGMFTSNAPALWERAAAAGAAQGAMAPVEGGDFWSEKAKQAGAGALVGTGGHALARTIGGLVKPTAEARQLMDAGVALTPGQAAGAGSFLIVFRGSLSKPP